MIEGSVPIYCKVDTSSRVPPLKVYIEVQEDGKKSKTVRSVSLLLRKRKNAQA